jgi:hypothetical protein
VEEEPLDHSPDVHIRHSRPGYESHATGLDRNEFGAMLAAAELGTAAEHALISLLALNGLRVSEATSADIEALGSQRGYRTTDGRTAVEATDLIVAAMDGQVRKPGCRASRHVTGMRPSCGASSRHLIVQPLSFRRRPPMVPRSDRSGHCDPAVPTLSLDSRDGNPVEAEPLGRQDWRL